MSKLRDSKAAWRALALLALILFGCSRERQADPCPECPVPVLPVDDSSACADWRWIGIKRPSPEANPKQPTFLAPCPPAKGWAVRHLFCPGAELRRGGRDPKEPPTSRDCDAKSLPPGLQPFCLYEALAPGAEAARSLAAKPPEELASVARDCMAVHPQATPLTQHLLPVLEARFLDQAGQPRELPVAVPAGESAANRIRLALLDTAPTNTSDPEARFANSPHGPTLAAMAKRLLCGPSGGACDIQVTARLALAYLTFDPHSEEASTRDDVHGGYVGFVGELAESIRQEVVAWQRSGEERLVLNFSVGWRGRVGGTNPPADEAVRAALEDAYCRGALALAAAGNREWGPAQKLHTGPLLPAAWERLPAPTVDHCNAALGATGPARDSDPPLGSYRPLLAAVGAVDATNTPLANARFDSEPRLVAFGDHGVVETPRAGKPTAILTGSSVATLVASAAAAAWWIGDPEAQPLTVVARLYQRGAGLGRNADFCQGSSDSGSQPCSDPRFEVRRVSLCASLGQTCPPGSPGAVEASGSATAAGGKVRLKVRDLPGFAGVRIRDVQSLRREQRSKACPPPWLARFLARPLAELAEVHHPRGTGSSRYPCPYWQLPGVYASASLGPQPGSDPCPPCGFGSGSPGTLVMEVDPDFEGRLSAPTLKVGRQSYPLNPGTLVLGQAIVRDVPYEPGQEVLLSFVLDGNRSLTSALLVFEREDL